jgi:NAD(P)-dependent dehydrogenase (short-subunit alcohol dehydrogenase family)
MKDLEEGGALLLELDLTQDSSIRAAVEAVQARGDAVTALINNAGYGSYGAVEDVPLSEARRQFEVNLFGASRLIQLILPTMRAAGSGRIVNISSVGGKMHEPFGAWYHATKFALEGYSDCLRMELAPHGIDVIVIEPGGIRTEWGGISRDGLMTASGESAYAHWATRHAEFLNGAATAKWLSDPDVVARTVAKALSARRPRTRYAIGAGAKPILFLRALLSDRKFDRLMWFASQRSRTAPSAAAAPAQAI